MGLKRRRLWDSIAGVIRTDSGIYEKITFIHLQCDTVLYISTATYEKTLLVQRDMIRTADTPYNTTTRNNEMIYHEMTYQRRDKPGGQMLHMQRIDGNLPLKTPQRPHREQE